MGPRTRGGLWALGALAAGAVVGALAEEVLYRGAFRAPDPEAGERFGPLPGEAFEVRSFDGTRLAGRVLGPADAVGCVFLHGLGLTSELWHYQVRDLAGGPWRLVAYDARGHGRSGPARGPGGRTSLTARTLARDLSAVLEGTGVRRAVVVGHSMGGMTALQFAADHPGALGEAVAGLALVNTTFTARPWTGSGSPPRLSGLRRRLAGAVGRVAAEPGRLQRLRPAALNDLTLLLTRLGFGAAPSRTHVALTRRMLQATPTETLAAAVAGLEGYDTGEVLERLAVPALVVAGDRDLLTPPWLAREMAERIPRAELVVFPGAGHMVPLERHAELSARLRRFLEAVG